MFTGVGILTAHYQGDDERRVEEEVQLYTSKITKRNGRCDVKCNCCR